MEVVQADARPVVRPEGDLHDKPLDRLLGAREVETGLLEPAFSVGRLMARPNDYGAGDRR